MKHKIIAVIAIATSGFAVMQGDYGYAVFFAGVFFIELEETK